MLVFYLTRFVFEKHDRIVKPLRAHRSGFCLCFISHIKRAFCNRHTRYTQLSPTDSEQEGERRAPRSLPRPTRHNKSRQAAAI